MNVLDSTAGTDPSLFNQCPLDEPASQVVVVGKNPPTNTGDERWGFNPWIRKIPWSTKWHPTPIFLPKKFHGQRSLDGYSPWGRKELDVTEDPLMDTEISSRGFIPPVYMHLHCLSSLVHKSIPVFHSRHGPQFISWIPCRWISRLVPVFWFSKRRCSKPLCWCHSALVCFFFLWICGYSLRSCISIQ